ncbi:hypothetical protein [Gloeocapsopsis sp. IPPAS B-1203]|uniref:hypothetical protein n=1 Tax=Gloeocapsopsis sp. IPPAS B-1203 TaxID=2049454 RepID=UPI000C185B46|nr:hypothetical protein [Gloeocapsopsis sp. IPPAS B-1203]PIG92805.1 hypothetical protein CSQ79_14620 [Gloeocapsopsis sp. IPPAS B-1203]
MAIWRFWLNTLILSSQYNPPRFVELIMLWIALILLAVWSLVPFWPYLVLSLSFVIGSSISILIREAIAPSPYIRATQVTAVLMLIISIYGLADVIQYFNW